MQEFIETQALIKKRQEIYEEVANQQLSLYKMIKAENLDRGMSGSSAESTLKTWIASWIPKKFTLENGAVLSSKDKPTNQMDCLIFNRNEAPYFTSISNNVLLPIEGVLGCIEINFGKDTPYTKIEKDARKLTLLNKIADNSLPPPGVVFTHRQVSDYNTVTQDDLIKNSFFHYPVMRKKSFL